jgi:hypothetical protein
VPSEIVLDTAQNYLLASVHRTKIASDPIAYQQYQEHRRALRKARKEGDQP